MSKRSGRAPLPWIREDRPITPDEVAWLRSPEGCAVCDAMAGGEPADTPAAIARWRQRLEPERVAAAWHQVELRRAASRKFSQADQMLFDRVGLEQATDEIVARYKAVRFANMDRVADLCCGIGGDSLAIGSVTEVLAVDHSRSRVAMAEHNGAVYGGRVTGLCDDVTMARPEADAVHVDPDRRSSGPRRHDPDAGSPNVEDLERIVSHYEHAAIKLSPGAPFEMLPFDGEIELISHQGSCKQAVIWTGQLQSARRRATALPSGETLTAETTEAIRWPESRSPKPGDGLYEPDAAVIRADLVGVLSRQHELHPIDPQIAYLTGAGDEIRTAQTALMTPFRIIDVMPWSEKKARKWLASHDIGKVDIKTRGFAGKPEEIQRKLRLKGAKQAVLFLTRSGDAPMAILAERVQAIERTCQ